MKDIKWILPLFTLLLLPSCMKEIDLEHLRPDPTLVLNGVMTAGQPVTARVTRTWFYTDAHPDVSLPDADVQLYVNDQLQEKLTWQTGDSTNNYRGYFQGAYIPRLGDRLKMTAAAGNYPEVWAEATIPEHVPILNVTYKYVRNDKNGYEDGKHYKLEITFQDDPDQENYYLIQLESRNVYKIWTDSGDTSLFISKWEPLFVYYEDDPLFTSSLTAMDKIFGFDWLSTDYGRVFTDDLINGKTYTINLSTTSYNYYTDPAHTEEEMADAQQFYCRIHLYSLSEPYYRYMKSMIEKEDGNMQVEFAESGLAEPMRIYSNVNGGTGILGGCNPDSVLIRLH